jgi:hypothetical protein
LWSGSRQDIHTSPTRNELIVDYGRIHFFPRNGLKASEGGAFKPIHEVFGDQSLVGRIVRFRAERHFIQNSDDALPIERHSQQMSLIVRQDKIRFDTVYGPAYCGEIASACLDRHSGVNRKILGHEPNIIGFLGTGQVSKPASFRTVRGKPDYATLCV